VGTVGAAAVAAAVRGSIADCALGCLVATVDVDTVTADADDGSFVVLADVSPVLIRGCLLFVGLDDTLLLELGSSLSAS